MTAAIGVGRLMRPVTGLGTPYDAAGLIGNEWNGFALDFLSNTVAVRVATNQAEQLLGSGPDTAEPGIGISFTDNSYALGTA